MTGRNSTGSLWSHDSDRGVAAVYHGISMDVIIAKVPGDSFGRLIWHYLKSEGRLRPL